ncbi:FecR family protein [Pedobacter caeni]|uniref:FecR family protein n=1 Tax=Pedobacter caeni TaxID=288992 RepID=A0A1M5EIH2_9SPHI|nr:FecR domain-containing protein [Pedobacter caeni]SHF78997.1 FecR family protein [Pedobacter caeni]
MEEINNSNHIPYHLIMDELEGKISTTDLQELESWKAANPDHLRSYQEILDIADHSELLMVYKETDPEQAWQRFEPSIPVETRIVSLHPQKKKGLPFLKWAAAVMVLISGAWFVANQRGWIGEETVRTGNEHQKLVLPDGTEVFMNANTTISYHKSGFLNSRNVELEKGEAYFNVIHDEKSPFSIKVGELYVNDLGTSFNLKVEPEQVVVVVNSGKVALEQGKETKKILLSAQDRGTFNKVTKEMSAVKNEDLNYKAWHDKTLHYQQALLTEVSDDMKELFGTQIVFQDSTLKERKLSAYFKNKSEEEIMNTIGETLRLKVTKRDGTFVLSN